MDPTKDELLAENAWEAVDHVAGVPHVTTYKRSLRLRQARWRVAQGLPIGHQRQRDGTSREIGSRMEAEHAMSTGANFLSDRVRAAVRDRLDHPEPHQTLDVRRLFADCLSSMPMCFNLFGELHGDAESQARAVHAWFPDAPVGAVELRFEWSPGRAKAEYLGNRSAFDAAFAITGADGSEAVVGIETKYHEHALLGTAPVGSRLDRYREVTERSGVFAEGAATRIVGTDLQQIWLDHLLVLSMLQHPEARYTWGRFVLVCPEANSSFRGLATRYEEELVVPGSFEIRTIEDLLATPGALPADVIARFRDRYLS